MPHYRREALHGGLVAGVDEVGRGPLAGPVVAAAVMFRRPPALGLAGKLGDSKRLSPASREAAYVALRDEPDAIIGVAAASVTEIERLNILRASLLAMARAVTRLAGVPDLVLVDGDRCPVLPCLAQAVVGGDGESLSIAAASVVAKVIRDRAMARLHECYPQYGWNSNAGYGTASHRSALLDLGPTVHHRRGFGPVREASLRAR